MDFNHKKVLVVGTGISGIGAVKLLIKANAQPVLYDSNATLDRDEIYKKLEGIHCEIILGNIEEEMIKTFQLAVISPGVPVDSPLVLKLKEENITVWGEIELAYRCGRGKILAITGTNGKTTTTALVGKIMEDYFGKADIVGNIGIAYTDTALDSVDSTVTVAEISSFQLETIEQFKPAVSAILNITPDHLNRHYTMENYAAVKESITKNQDETDTCVLNYEDKFTRSIGQRCNCKVVYFSSKRKLEQGIYFEEDVIYIADKKSIIKALNVHDMKLLGIHNVENVMAAIGMALSFQIPLLNIIATVKSFKAVEHRIEYVATKDGVDYYNDSKGTNPDAAIKGIQAMNRPTILIGGGYDKMSEYDEWIESFDGKVKYLVLIGQTRDKIAQCAKRHGFDRIIMAEDLAEALNISRQKAVEGDAVLLSPACASWGMFPNYEVRGTMFKQIVNSF